MSIKQKLFWCCVPFPGFMKHFRKMNDEQIVRDIRQSMDDLEDIVPDTDTFGSQMVRWALERLEGPAAAARRENGKKGGRPKKSPQDAPNGNAGVDMSDAGNGDASKSQTSCGTFTADGDIREDSQDITTSGNGSVTESGTSANLYGDAHRREAGKVVNSRESGAFAPTTVSRNMRRVPQNEAPAHGFSGGRTAHGTMSRSPEAAAQSGKDYDQETDQVSTRASNPRTGKPIPAPQTGNNSNGTRQAEARQSQRAVANAPKGGRTSQSHSATARSSGAMPEDVQLVYDFAAAEGLDTADAYECWHVTVNERDGLTADGKPIKNWKAYVRKWCETRAGRRNA